MSLTSADSNRPNQSRTRALRPEIVSLAILFVAVVILFLTAPRNGDFWWSDAPRHAMDGVFYHDLLRDGPWSHLPQYAADYYLRYPALTILFYPPLFPLVEAGFFGIFGVSHSTAQLTVAFFYLLAAWGGYVLTRRWMQPAAALATSLLFVGLPEVALWGRQIMLEIPTIAFVLWAAVAFFRYVDLDRGSALWTFFLLMAAAAYTKQTSIWFLAPCLIFLVGRKGWRSVFDRRILVGAITLVVILLPLAYVSWRFGRVNMNSVVGGTWTTMPVFSVASWLFYLKALPEQAGWPVVVFALFGLIVAFARKQWNEQNSFAAAWFAVGYIFFSCIALKETRHTTLILFPVAIFAIHGVQALLKNRAGLIAGILGSTILFGYNLQAKPVPYIGGYDRAVRYISANAPPNSVILFSGYRDGNLVFDLRSVSGRKDLAILRADKIFLRVTQRKELGVKDLGMSKQEMQELLNRYGVTYVVSQPNFWDDVESLRTLRSVFQSSGYQQVATIETTGNVGRNDMSLEIYRNLNPGPAAGNRIKIELPIVGVAVEGVMGVKP